MNRSKTHRMLRIALICVLAAVSVTASNGPVSAKTTPRWIAAWAAPITDSAIATLGSTGGGPSNATVRNVAFVTLGGSAVRIRLSNEFGGDVPLKVGSATIAVRKAGAQIETSTARRITFAGKPGVTIKPGTDFVYSDPVRFAVKALQIVAVSLYFPNATNPPANTANYNTSYQAAADSGDLTKSGSGDAFTTTMTSTYALTAIDVLTTEANGAIVGLGSSSFHGTAAEEDSYGRVLDGLSVRVNKLIGPGSRKSVLSAGIGGDTLHAGLGRLARDVLTQTGITGVILYDINDLSSRTAEQIIDDYRIAIKQSHAKRVLVFCPTWPPAAQSNAGRPMQERSKLNAWILNSGECDDVVDWNAVLEDQNTHETYRLQYFADGIHPNQAGHKAMSEATPLRWFTARFPAG